MADSPIGVLIEMIALVIQNSIGTIQSLWKLLIDLINTLTGATASGGPVMGFIAIVILVAVIFLLAKFVFNSGKQIIILLAIGAFLFFVVMLSLF